MRRIEDKIPQIAIDLLDTMLDTDEIEEEKLKEMVSEIITDLNYLNSKTLFMSENLLLECIVNLWENDII